ncbi:MAG: hypothetical protein NVV74_01175 [Magnetospirillum sp.]|nr:hypothetical protein [Magnetospirillum sp.]
MSPDLLRTLATGNLSTDDDGRDNPDYAEFAAMIADGQIPLDVARMAAEILLELSGMDAPPPAVMTGNVIPFPVRRRG